MKHAAPEHGVSASAQDLKTILRGDSFQTHPEFGDRRLDFVPRAGVSEEALDSLVHRLRERLREAGATRRLIVTVRGHGLRLDL